MKGLSRTLLGGLGLAAATGAACADELSSLKAELESLQSRVSQLEAQEKASLPTGYNFVSIRGGQPYFDFDDPRPEKRDNVIPQDTGFTFSVLPAGDVAPTAEVFVTAESRTALIYTDFEADDNLDVATRTRFIVRGKADTAVGEVGGFFRMQASGGGDFSDFDEFPQMHRAYGWWKFAPDWQLLAGQEDTTATLVTSWDWLAATAPVRSFGPSDAYNEQMRLMYTSGAWSFGVALEDPDNISTETEVGSFVDGDGDGVIDPANPADLVITTVSSDADKSDLPMIPAYVVYSGETFTGQIVGLYQDDDYGADDWAIGGGVAITLAEGFQVFGAAVVGEGTSVYANNLAPIDTDESFWLASGGLLANITEQTRIELGVGYEDYEDAGEALGVGGGIYWTPITLVSLGVGATYVDFTDAFVDADPTSDDSLQVFFGVWWRGFKY